MKLGVRSKLFLLSLGMIAATLLAADISLRVSLDRWLVERAREGLTPRVELIAGALDRAEPSDYERLALDLGRRAHARVTIVARDGKVIGDSEVADPNRLESHADRPEIRQALESGAGSSTRYSHTLRRRMMYAAVPFQNGVVRLAMPLTEVDETLAQARSLLLLAAAVALVVAIFMSSIASHLSSRALRSLAATARRMAGGDLSARTRMGRGDEIGELARAIDVMAAGLSVAMADLKTDRDLLQSILDGMQEGVLVLDREQRIVRANAAVHRRLLNQEARGQLLLEGIRNADLKRVLESAPASGEIELRGAFFLVKASPLEDGVLAVFVDVTELRRMESVRREFVANVSHELRTPVTAVLSGVETLRSAALNDPEAAGQFLSIIERNARRMHHLVEDLLELSRLQSGARRLELEPVALKPLLGGTPNDVADELCVLADRGALEQVLQNLIDNARKYAHDVRVSAAELGGRVRVLVSDTGPGIEARHLPRLFERFYRVDEGRSRELGGTGLGLAIVKHLVEAMDGTVEVESTPGKGSIFSFTLRR
ncbi:MAG: HAMP domain-containing protein [Armatimonadetes bacterium]|nr:HAMP domain-containing protein [Armatimonadota bacterium]